MDTPFNATLLGSGMPSPDPLRFGPATLIQAGPWRVLIDDGINAPRPYKSSLTQPGRTTIAPWLSVKISWPSAREPQSSWKINHFLEAAVRAGPGPSLFCAISKQRPSRAGCSARARVHSRR